MSAFRWVLRGLVWLCLMLSLGLTSVGPALASPLRVTFLNPGHQDESFWSDVDHFMQAAADNLGIQLSIVHGERDSERILALADGILQADPKPDYIILVNEKATGPELLRRLAPSGAGILFILNDLTATQKASMGAPRTQFKNWLGSLIPDNHWVGHATAAALYAQLKKLKPNQPHYQMFAISGDSATPASQEREQGMRDFVAEHPDLELTQVVYGHWVENRAHEQTLLLLKRYPQTDAIWTANDHMAFGALAAAKSLGRTPGKDLLLSSVNSSKEVLELTDQGVISALGAGHFSAGGWALVMLYDYAHGHDFASEGTLLQRPLFEMIPAGSPVLQLLLKSDWGSIDFHRYSKTDGKLAQYRFQLGAP